MCGSVPPQTPPVGGIDWTEVWTCIPSKSLILLTWNWPTATGQKDEIHSATPAKLGLWSWRCWESFSHQKSETYTKGSQTERWVGVLGKKVKVFVIISALASSCDWSYIYSWNYHLYHPISLPKLFHCFSLLPWGSVTTIGSSDWYNQYPLTTFGLPWNPIAILSHILV